MKLPEFLFLLLVAMSVVLGVVLIGGEPGDHHGVAHKTFDQTMQQGGSGPERHDHLRWLGWAFGALMIIFFVGGILLGVQRAAEHKWPYLLGGTVYVLIFSLLALADHGYAGEQPAPLVLGFPLPTTLMLYGLWGIPAVFILLYTVKFDRWILTSEDLQRFEALLRRGSDEEENGD